MSLYDYDVKLIQEKYLQLLNLQGLKRHASGKWNFRCPLCGDSKRNANKKRGWFTPDMRVFSCFNCGKRGIPFDKYLEMVSPTLLHSYKQEISAAWLEANRKEVPELPKGVIPEEQAVFDKRAKKIEEDRAWESVLPQGTVPVWELAPDHPAREWLAIRLITEEMCIKYGISYCTAKKGPYKNRVIFPMVWKDRGIVYGFQARTLDGDTYPKYLTQVIDGYPKIWNMFNVDHNGDVEVQVTEGIIDAMFLQNAIALCGSDISDHYLSALKSWNFCFIFDNDVTGRAKSMKFAKLGYKVFVWPPDCTAKDINQAIMEGANIRFDKCFRAFTGAEAVVRLKLRR